MYSVIIKMAICLFIGQTSLSRVDFSTCYHLLSLHTNSVSQKLKLDQSPSSQTSCCIPPDISWETWHSPPRNTVLNLETLIAHWFFKAVFNIRAQKIFISLTAKKKKRQQENNFSAYKFLFLLLTDWVMRAWKRLPLQHFLWWTSWWWRTILSQ